MLPINNKISIKILLQRNKMLISSKQFIKWLKHKKSSNEFAFTLIFLASLLIPSWSKEVIKEVQIPQDLFHHIYNLL
jgi:hypothetical protein